MLSRNTVDFQTPAKIVPLFKNRLNKYLNKIKSQENRSERVIKTEEVDIKISKQKIRKPKIKLLNVLLFFSNQQYKSISFLYLKQKNNYTLHKQLIKEEVYFQNKL